MDFVLDIVRAMGGVLDGDTDGGCDLRWLSVGLCLSGARVGVHKINYKNSTLIIIDINMI